MLQLKEYVREFMSCEVGDGRFASFWFDNWTDLGQLITLIGDNGPRLLRIRLDARVADATRLGSWHLPAARSDSAQELQIRLIDDIPPPNLNRGSDSFLWRHVPRFSFATWLALRNRLPTRDRLRGWGMDVPSSCLLCSNGLETHDHLFFSCPFSL
ncbi:hypothetical protein V5N11_020313 [Cardamine amara subsp. amara]|uniref:Reverse transcriptase zinc-binding domain-containing protein n=1 Tax=Cardamine amara subsp. amara TaxID=228776 RepID=A0ABD1C2W6_CARAN